MAAPDHSDPTPLLPSHIKRFLFLRGVKEEDASVRIHFLSAERALRQYAEVPVEACTPTGGTPRVDKHTCIAFFYNDSWAVNLIRSDELAKSSALSICFGSDIKDYAQYHALSDLVDCFAMPTDRHTDVLQLNVRPRVRTVRECIDSIALSQQQTTVRKPGRALVWFGYPESYYRSMAGTQHVIQSKLRQGKLSEYAIITDGRHLDSRASAAHVVPYRRDTFAADLRRYDYAILSHVPCDLQVNTLIKSPNKLITALAAGLVPLVSHTPNYADLVAELGLERFVFKSPFELSRKLDDLDPLRDRQAIVDSQAVHKLDDIFGVERIYGDLAKLLDAIAPEVEEIRRFVAAAPAPGSSNSFRNLDELLRELGPSSLRSLHKRIRALS